MLGLSRPTIAEMSQVWSPERAGGYCRRCGQGSGPGNRPHQVAALPEKWGSPGWCHHIGAICRPVGRGNSSVEISRSGRAGPSIGASSGEGCQGRFPRGLDSRRWTVVPMPMPFWRKIDRRVDHARLIALCVASSLGLGHVQPLKRQQGCRRRDVLGPIAKRPAGGNSGFAGVGTGVVIGRIRN